MVYLSASFLRLPLSLEKAELLEVRQASANKVCPYSTNVVWMSCAETDNRCRSSSYTLSLSQSASTVRSLPLWKNRPLPAQLEDILESRWAQTWVEQFLERGPGAERDGKEVPRKTEFPVASPWFWRTWFSYNWRAWHSRGRMIQLKICGLKSPRKYLTVCSLQ